MKSVKDIGIESGVLSIIIMVHDVPFEPVCKTCQYDNIEIK